MSRAALCAVFALGLAGCELVIGGESHAMIKSSDGAVEGVDPADAASDATREADSAVADTATPNPDTGPHGPCMPPPSCMQSEQTCANDCNQQYDTCMKGPGDPHGNQCKSDLDDCTATCQSTCDTCVGCSGPAPECVLK